MSKRQYPRQAWVLLPSFKPKEITIVNPYRTGQGEEDWDVAEGGKFYHKDHLFPSMSAAIAYGRAQVEKQAADIEKRQAMLDKRTAALDKAEAASKGDQAATDGASHE